MAIGAAKHEFMYIKAHGPLNILTVKITLLFHFQWKRMRWEGRERWKKCCVLFVIHYSLGNLKDADYYVHKWPHIACYVNRTIDLRLVFVCTVLISSLIFLFLIHSLADIFLSIYSRTMNSLLFHSHHSFLHRFVDYTSFVQQLW